MIGDSLVEVVSVVGNDGGPTDRTHPARQALPADLLLNRRRAAPNRRCGATIARPLRLYRCAFAAVRSPDGGEPCTGPEACTGRRSAMAPPTSSALSYRDRAVLRAIEAGRCEVSGRVGVALVIDGLGCSDQFVGQRLVRAGLVAVPGPQPGPARLTASGRAMLLEAA
jgi:hypothetical protein